MKLFNRLAAGSLASLVAFGASAQVVAPPDVSAYLTAVNTSATGYAPIMFALALLGVGIGVGVKFVKKAKGAI